jgi:superfamily I DNA/RNA helicase
LQVFPPGDLVTVERLQTIFEPGSLASLMAAYEAGCPALLAWWRARVVAEFRNRIDFPARVLSARGSRTLVEEPKVVVGTIHSVKGGEADVVYLFPDLSRAADAQYQRFGPARDSVIRVFYVGATRAREILYICSGESATAVSI